MPRRRAEARQSRAEAPFSPTPRAAHIRPSHFICFVPPRRACAGEQQPARCYAPGARWPRNVLNAAQQCTEPPLEATDRPRVAVEGLVVIRALTRNLRLAQTQP